MSFLVASGGQQLFIQSDVTGLHHLFVKNPGWHSMFDMDGPKAEATRRAFFDRVIAEKGMIAGYHFGFPNVGTLSKDGNGSCALTWYWANATRPMRPPPMQSGRSPVTLTSSVG